MNSKPYPYVEIAALDAIRARFAAGEAMAILTPALDEVVWANGAGATLFGYADVNAIVGAAPQIGLAAKRQIAATSGYPKIGLNRAITVRLASGLMSRAVAFSASEIALPGGGDAILLVAAASASGARGTAETANRAIAGLDGAGRQAAILDAAGGIVAASDGLAGLGVEPAALSRLARGERLIDETVTGAHGRLAACAARLTDEPALYLAIISEHALEDPVAEARPADTEEPVEETEQADGHAPGDADGSESQPPAFEAEADDTNAAMTQTSVAEPESEPAPAGTVEQPPEPVAADSQQAADDDDQRTQAVGAAVADAQIAASLSLAEADSQQPIADRPAADVPAGNSGDEPEDIASTAPRARATDDVATTMARIASTVNEGLAAKEAAAISEENAAADRSEAAPSGDAPDDDERRYEADIVVDRSAAPVRFVWKTDAQGRLSEIAREFVAVVGASAAGLVGSSFREIAQRLGIDRSGEIAGLLERRDTWSGRSVLWPVEGTDLRVPVDLAALPTYDRDRNFAGFRGFGVARAADAIVDPDADAPAPADDPAATDGDLAGDAAKPQGADPFRGEVPVLTIVPKQDRRVSDKIIRLAEHRGPAGERSLSPGEQNAFREIGNRLKKDNGATGAETAEARRADNDQPSAQAHVDASAPDSGSHEESTFEVENVPAPDASRPDSEALGRELADDGSAEDDARASEYEPATEREPEAGHDSELDAFAEAAAAQEHRGEEAADVEIEPAGDEFEPDAAATAAADGEAADDGDASASAIPGEPSAPREPAAFERPAQPGYMPSAFASPADKAEPAPVDTSILEQLPVPVLIHAGDVLHYANREFLDLTGYDGVGDLAEAGGLGVLFGEPYPAEEGAEENGRKLRLRTSEGLEYPVEAFLQSVPWGEGKALLLSLRRSWRQPVSYPVAQPAPPPADPDLETRIAEMRAIVDTATDGVVLITADGLIRSISRPAEALFGFDSEQVAGKPFASLFAIESQRAARDYLNGLTDHGVASVLNDGREVIGREAQGRFIPLFMTIGKLPDDSGYCAVVRDITQWKRAEEELTQARAQAERASSQKTDFLARVSHEIRTPLNAIIGFSELMLDEKFGPIHNDRYKDYLRDINRSGNHVLDLVNDLLDISKIEAGQQEMSYEAVSLNDTLTETVAMMQPQANRERVIIRSSFASRLPEVVADLRSVRQIALNLLSNAIRYTPAGGQVIVSTAYESSGDVVMRVRDTGIGMSQPEIEQALKPFKQINALKRTRGDGTGLGLPLTKAMVEANRARFMINSTPGEGTLVEITFPSTRVLAD